MGSDFLSVVSSIVSNVCFQAKLKIQQVILKQVSIIKIIFPFENTGWSLVVQHELSPPDMKLFRCSAGRGRTLRGKKGCVNGSLSRGRHLICT